MLNAVETDDIGQLKKMLTNQIASFQHPLTFDTAMVVIVLLFLCLSLDLTPHSTMLQHLLVSNESLS